MKRSVTSLQWDAHGVEVTLPVDQDGRVETRRLSHAEVAALTNYDAQTMGLPLTMEAVLSVRIEGRIDMPEFRVEHTIEPFNHMHPWVVYRREGALLFVGERIKRLNTQQLRVFDALELIKAAGNDVAMRLEAWPVLVDALHAGKHHHVLVESELPRVRVRMAERLPDGAMTRVGTGIVMVSQEPDARWAMDAHRQYYLRRPA